MIELMGIMDTSQILKWVGSSWEGEVRVLQVEGRARANVQRQEWCHYTRMMQNRWKVLSHRHTAI